MENIDYHKENIKNFALTTMFNSKKMYRLLSDEADNTEINEIALYGYHSMAFSSYLTMKSYYLQNDTLAHHEFDKFFDKMSQFSREFVSSRETGHSMQWTFGYYNELAEAFNELADLLEIDHIEIPK